MQMQLNIYVPRTKASVLKELDRVSRETGRQKNALVLEALERFLESPPPELPRFSLGKVKPWTRAELYEARLKRVR